MSSGKNTKVIYTALFGDYDTLLDPIEECKDFDFICFTDQNIQSETWEVIKVIPDLPPSLMNRKYKLLPHLFLKNYQKSIYIDTNIRIKENPLPLFEECILKSSFCAPIHFIRNSYFDEGIALIKIGKFDSWKVLKVLAKYLNQGYYGQNGLTENNILFRNHHDAKVINIMSQWWKIVSKEFSRDQMSLGFVCWKNDFKIHIFKENSRIKNSPFEWISHKKMEQKKKFHFFKKKIYLLLSLPLRLIYWGKKRLSRIR